MTDRLYERYLTKERIVATCESFGFDDALRVERHIMDFEIHRIIGKDIPVCVRGGMAAPLYMPKSFMRLSEDIDMYAFETMDAIKMRMRRLEARFGAYGITPEEYEPAGGGQPIPLVTYYMWYASAMGVPNTVKIDFLCDPQLEHLPRRTFQPPICLGHFVLTHLVDALDAGSLVADKITSLSTGTIGYPPGQKRKMNKQIYDIGQLLRHMSNDQIAQAVSQYARLASHKGRYPQEYGNTPAHEADAIAADVCHSLLSIFGSDNRFILGSEFRGHFGAFKGAYLGRRPHSESSHRTDTLFTLLFAAVLLEHGRDNMSTARAVGVIRGAADILKLMGNPSTRKDGKTRIAGSAPSDSHLEDRIRNLPLESQYLLRQVSSVSPGLLERRR